MSDSATRPGLFALEDVEQLAHQFAHRHLSEYTKAIQESGRAFSRKEVNDALWGTIGLTPIEVALLDSPLLQRLRYVRQLGVIHWIYPGAVHTRFEHTLGVLHQVHHLTSALNAISASAPEAPGGPLINGAYAQLLRLCALLHDVGHAAFSHVSEMAIEALPTMTAITAAFAKKEGGEQKQLSEIFAYYVVRSPALEEFFGLMLDRAAPDLKFHTDRRRNLGEIIDKASSAIIGRKIDDRLPLLHELISGPFDADKLDYFVRDAKLAGTPSLLDISRLVQKLTVRYLDSKDLPRDIGRNVRSLSEKHCLFGIKWSGVAVLDELQLARVLLYAKIYRHPKVVAIEQMMRAAIVTMAKVVTVDRLLKLLYTHADDALLTMGKEVLASGLGLEYGSLDTQQREWLQLTESIFKAVRERRLWVRAYLIAVRYPSDPLAPDQKQKDGLVGFIEQVEHPQRRTEFTDALITEVDTVLRGIEGSRIPSREELHASIMVHVLNSTAPGGTQIARAYVLPSKGTPIPFREYVVNRSGWADSYLSDQPKGYIFCPPEIADAVYIAVERLVRVKFDVQLPSTALELSKRDTGLVEEQKRKLLAQGYYRGSPIDVRPVPKRLEKADVADIVQKFDQRVRSAYQEPQSNESAAGQVPADSRTMMWLRQFDDETHLDCALQLLDSFRLIQRGDIVQTLKSFVQKFPEFEGAYLVPFGSARDSSAIHTYFAADLVGSVIAKCVTVDELADAPDDVKLIFLDDFAISGGQTIDVLAAGLGHDEDRKDLGEQRSLFDEKVRRLLQSNRIGFVYAAAWDLGMKNVREAVEKWKISAEVYRYLDETQIPFAQPLLRAMPQDVVQAFLSRCTEIGRQLILGAPQSDKEAQCRAEQKAINGALGYGNRGMLIASPFNVPTQTLTAMWSTGQVDGTQWMPLLSRRKKN